MTTVSPATVGRVAMRMSSRRPGGRGAERDPAVLRACGARRCPAWRAPSGASSRQVRGAAGGFAASRAGRRRSGSGRCRPSSCASKWTSLAPSSAASSMIELTMRTIGPSETPSSSSRSAIRHRLLGARPRRAISTPRRTRGPCGRARPGCRRARRRRARAGSESRAGARRSPGRSADRRARRGASRPRGGTAARRRGGARGAASACSPPTDTLVSRRSTSGRPVARGEHAGHALARGKPLRDQRVDERLALARPAPHERQAVERDERRSPRSGRRAARPARCRLPAAPDRRSAASRAPRPPSAGGGRAARCGMSPTPGASEEARVGVDERAACEQRDDRSEREERRERNRHLPRLEP